MLFYDVRKILVAASVACCFFSISDVYLSLSRYQKNIEDQEMSYLEWNENLITNQARYTSLFGKFHCEETKTMINKLLEDIQKRKDVIAKTYNNRTTYQNMSFIFFSIAIFSLCVIIGFSRFFEFMSVYTDIFTIMAFISIIMNYLICDYATRRIRKRKEDISESRMSISTELRNLEDNFYGLVEKVIEITSSSVQCSNNNTQESEESFNEDTTIKSHKAKKIKKRKKSI